MQNIGQIRKSSISSDATEEVGFDLLCGHIEWCCAGHQNKWRARIQVFTGFLNVSEYAWAVTDDNGQLL